MTTSSVMTAATGQVLNLDGMTVSIEARYARGWVLIMGGPQIYLRSRRWVLMARPKAAARVLEAPEVVARWEALCALDPDVVVFPDRGGLCFGLTLWGDAQERAIAAVELLTAIRRELERQRRDEATGMASYRESGLDAHKLRALVKTQDDAAKRSVRAYEWRWRFVAWGAGAIIPALLALAYLLN